MMSGWTERPRSARDWMLFLFRQVVLLLFAYLLIGGMWNNENWLYDCSFWIVFPLTGLTAAAWYWLYRLSEHGVRRFRRIRVLLIEHDWVALCVVVIIVLMLQLPMAYALYGPVGWDVDAVVRSADPAFLPSAGPYFSQYPNNLMLLAMNVCLFQLYQAVSNFSIWLFLAVINLLLLDLALILTFQIAKRAFSLAVAYWSIALLIPLLLVSPWIVIPYTDTFVIPFMLLPMDLLLRYRDGKIAGLWKRGLLFLGVGVCLYTAYQLKPTALIPYIAAAVILLLTRGSRLTFRRWRQYFAVLGSITAGVMIAAIGLIAFIHCSGMDLDKSKALGPSHFLMMGLSGKYGSYHEQDVEFSINQPYETRTKANLEVAAQRLKEKGFGGYMRFLERKARFIMGDGTFFWGGEGNFLDFTVSEEDNAVKALYRSIYYPGQPYHDVYIYGSQALWFSILFLIAAPLFRRPMDYREPYIQIARCSVFGLLLFLLLFEARSRYLINQAPIFCMLAAYGLQQLRGRRKNRSLL